MQFYLTCIVEYTWNFWFFSVKTLRTAPLKKLWRLYFFAHIGTILWYPYKQGLFDCMCKEVNDILSLWWSMVASLQAISPQQRKLIYWQRFINLYFDIGFQGSWSKNISSYFSVLVSISWPLNSLLTPTNGQVRAEKITQ